MVFDFADVDAAAAFVIRFGRAGYFNNLARAERLPSSVKPEIVPGVAFRQRLDLFGSPLALVQKELDAVAGRIGSLSSKKAQADGFDAPASGQLNCVNSLREARCSLE